MSAKVGGAFVCLALLLSLAQSQPEANMTVGGSANFVELVRTNRPSPFFRACIEADSVTKNFAAGMAVTMSTTNSASTGGYLATDGKLDQNYAQTKLGANPYLMVDMGQGSLVGRVTINFPSSGNFQGMEIRVGDDITNGGANNPICAALNKRPSRITTVFCDPALTGHYLTLRIPGASKTVAACEVAAYAMCASQGSCPNIALKQPTKQPTTGWSGSSGRGVDGNRNSVYFFALSCTHTLLNKNPWWYVDLGAQQPVRKITVTNRGDGCCWTRLNGFEIRVGNDNTNGGTRNKKCTATIPNFGRGETRTITCDSLMHGRYVFIRIPGRKEYLTLCEVEVYGDCTPSLPPCIQSGCVRGKSSNVALGRSAAQSSNQNNLYVASKANDGIYRTPGRYCAHTGRQTDPWWRVDLGCERTVSMVTVMNPGDCCQSRLNGFKVAIGNNASNGGRNNPICGAGVDNIGKGLTVSVSCPNLKGRYVSVYLKGANKILSICEVQVFEYCDQECYNLAQGQPVSSTSPINSTGQTSNAVDGNRNTNFGSHSCYLSDIATNPYFTVDLGHVRQIGKVRIFNRGDCNACSNGLDNFEVRVGFQSVGRRNARCYNGATKQSVYKNQAVDVMCNANRWGEFVTVIQVGINQQLSLCELEVYETGTCNDRGCYNHAEGKGTAISSLSSERWPASNAVDGAYRWRNMFSDNCTLSKTQTNPWFRVDLFQEVIVTKVYIANRGDCCGDRMTNFEIHVGNSLVNSGNSNPTCRRNLPAMSDNQYAFWFCPEMQGRYVNLLIRKSGGILNFCEIQVCGRLPINRAHGKPTAQSSTRSGGLSSRAVDSNRAPDWNTASCTYTNSEKSPWWRVDLLEERRVTSVQVTNRRDCCSDRLNGFEIRIGNSLEFEGNRNEKCISKTPNIGSGKTETILCGANGAGLNGRYINIIIPGDSKTLTLCEVAVVSKSVGKCMLSGKWKQGCEAYCDAGKGGIGCHSCPAGRVGRIRHIDSGLCVIPDSNLTYPSNGLRPVVSSKCDGIDSLFLFSESGLFYHIPSGYCLHIDGGGRAPKEGQELVFWNDCDALQNRLQFDLLSDGHLKNRQTKECVRVNTIGGVPSEGSKLVMHRICRNSDANYEFTIDEDAGKQWSVAINIVTNDTRFNYMSDTWFNHNYFGNASDLSKNAFLRAYDNVLVDYLSVQINNVEKIVYLPDDVAGKYTLKDLVLRDGILSITPALKGQMDAFNFKTNSSPVAYCTNEGFNFQLTEHQKWFDCQSYARIGIPLDNAVSTGTFQLGYNNKCIHVFGGGFTTPPDGNHLVSWENCIEERLRFTYRADHTFQHTTGKCLGFTVSKPVKGTPIVIKQCGASAKFTWRSDGVIVYSTNPLLCWAVEGIPTEVPGNGKKIILSDVCDPKKNPIYKFTFLKAGYNTSCQKPTSVEGIGLFSGCNMKSLASGRLLKGADTFARATVRIYGRPSCNPETSEGCSPQMGYCSCKNGYFGASCEYQCPDGRFGRLCRQTCQCKNGGKCDFKTGNCECPCGLGGSLCQFPCRGKTYGPGCTMLCNCSDNAAGCDGCSGECLCNAGYGGPRCNQSCGASPFAGMWGHGCLNKCQCKFGTCHPSTGKCTCYPEYTGILCEAKCQRSTFGKRCAQVCVCHHGGSCSNFTSVCSCSAGFFGASCEKPCIEGQCGQNCLQTCGCANGKCNRVTCRCTCDTGWTGAKCDKVCPSGSYGDGCAQVCKCNSQAQCSPIDGTCTCPPGKSSLLCDKPCTPTHFGKDCAQTCACKNGACDPVTGACTCTPGWMGAACDVSCPTGKFGDRCNETCSCEAYTAPEICNFISGDCVCRDGWNGVRCDSQCAANKWGANCSQICTCKNNGSCHPTTGACECKPGYTGGDCGQTCSTGKFGVDCGYSCTCIQGNSECNPVDGTCSCQLGWRGHDCDLPCTAGLYGQNCTQVCTCANGRCDPVSGQCQCDNGWAGSDCSQRCPRGTYGLKCNFKCKCDRTAICNAVDGSCTCAPGMQGKYCTHGCHGYFGHDCLAKCPPCGPNVISSGDCDPATGQCQCAAGYSGVLCEDPCPTGTWGAGCNNQCECKNGDCDPLTGACTCFRNHTGILCDKTCPDDFFGENCQFKCACSHAKKTCDPVTGACSCAAGWQPDLCVKPCPNGWYGVDCQMKCSCRNGECDPVTGECSCIAGFMGDDCGTPCNSSTWGPNCLYNCDECENYEVCKPNNGSCTCNPGWIGAECATPCPLGKYGFGCRYDCECKFNGLCDHVTGGCNCTTGFWGALCEKVGCPNGTWGQLCQQKCDCLPQQECSVFTGECSYPQSYYDAEAKAEDDSSSLSTAEIGIIIGCIVVVIVVVVLVFLYRKRPSKNKTPAVVFTNEEDLAFGYPDDNGDIKNDSDGDGFTNPMDQTEEKTYGN